MLKKNEIGNALKIVGFIVMILGVISSIISAFKSQPMMDDFMGLMMGPGVTSSMGVDYAAVIKEIVFSVAAGATLIGISEIIFILDEHRENSRRMCRRFGIEPAEYDKYADAKKAMKRMAKQEAEKEAQAQAEAKAQAYKTAQQAQEQPQPQFNEQPQPQQPSNNIHEDYGDE